MNTMNMLIMPLGIIGPWQLVLIVLVVLLLFGGKKIPELMRGLGKGVTEFKKGIDDAEKEFKKATSSDSEKKEDKVLEPDKIERTK